MTCPKLGNLLWDHFRSPFLGHHVDAQSTIASSQWFLPTSQFFPRSRNQLIHAFRTLDATSPPKNNKNKNNRPPTKSSKRNENQTELIQHPPIPSVWFIPNAGAWAVAQGPDTRADGFFRQRPPRRPCAGESAEHKTHLVSLALVSLALRHGHCSVLGRHPC